MSIAQGNCYWTYSEADIGLSGKRVMIQVREGDPLRLGTCVTIDTEMTIPVLLVEDDYGQVWSVAAKQVWVEDVGTS